MRKNLSKLGVIICIIATILALAGCGGSRRNVSRDPNGFLGYSDSFWEWYADNN